jgi:hypothetical protein
MAPNRRHYSELERAEGIALAVNIGPLRAAEQLGYPIRTVTDWMHHPRVAHSTVRSNLSP